MNKNDAMKAKNYFDGIQLMGFDVNDDGVVSVFGQNQSSMKECLAIIEEILEEPELDKVYKGKVVKIVEFGAFVNILPGKDGLLHISEISNERTLGSKTDVD